MIERACAVEFTREAINGRTGPLLLVCETNTGEFVELFCKFSAGCDQGVTNLAREVIAACLAADLNLPVPKPYLVEIPLIFPSLIRDGKISSKVARSVPLAFGSKRANQYSAWTIGNRVPASKRGLAASVILFDGSIQNPDRRVGNPNCLVKGDEFRLIDHELAFFPHKLLLGWRAPWIVGGLESLARAEHRHIFLNDLMGEEIDFQPITNAWEALSDGRISEYLESIPEEWSSALPEIKDAVKLIIDVRDNIEACIAEVQRILK